MSEQSPYEQLGINENASFDEIQEARDRMVEAHSGDVKVAEAIEAAYDAILMHRLKLRQEGKLKVPDRIRFPEKLPQPTAPPTLSSPTKGVTGLLNWLDAPSQNEVVLSLGVFALLGGLVVLVSTTQVAIGLQLILTLGLVACWYFLYRKEHRSGRALLITLVTFVGGLLLGALVTTGLEALAVLPSAQEGMGDTLVALFVLWLVSAFLR